MARLIQNTLKLNASGTAQQIDSTPNQELLSITVTAGPANTGTLYVGLSTVDADGDPSIGQPISPGEVMDIDLSEFKQGSGLPQTVSFRTLWFDGSITGDTLVYFGLIT